MEEPQKPEPGDCCGSGCTNCVWTVYYDQLEKYEEWQAKQEAASKDGNNASSPSTSPKSEELTHDGAEPILKTDEINNNNKTNDNNTSTNNFKEDTTSTKVTEEDKLIEDKQNRSKLSGLSSNWKLLATVAMICAVVTGVYGLKR